MQLREIFYTEQRMSMVVIKWWERITFFNYHKSSQIRQKSRLSTKNVYVILDWTSLYMAHSTKYSNSTHNKAHNDSMKNSVCHSKRFRFWRPSILDERMNLLKVCIEWNSIKCVIWFLLFVCCSLAPHIIYIYENHVFGNRLIKYLYFYYDCYYYFLLRPTKVIAITNEMQIS